MNQSIFRNGPQKSNQNNSLQNASLQDASFHNVPFHNPALPNPFEDASLLSRLDLGEKSSWSITTPGDFSQGLPFYCTEAGHFYGLENFYTKRDFKDSYLIFLTLSGEGYFTQAGETLRLTPGSLLLADCRSPQQYGTSNVKATDGFYAPSSAPLESPSAAPSLAPSVAPSWEHLWIHMNGLGVQSLFRALQEHLGTDKDIPLILTDAGMSVTYDFKDRFQTLQRLLPKESTDSFFQISLLLHEILNSFARGLLSESVVTGSLPASSSQRDQDIKKAAAYIRDHFQDPVNIPELLELTHMSKAYFMQLFRRYTGTTPYNYLLRLRISKAKELLTLSDLSIQEISEAVGFSDETNFSTRFKKMTGTSPMNYRKGGLG